MSNISTCMTKSCKLLYYLGFVMKYFMVTSIFKSTQCSGRFNPCFAIITNEIQIFYSVWKTGAWGRSMDWRGSMDILVHSDKLWWANEARISEQDTDLLCEERHWCPVPDIQKCGQRYRRPAVSGGCRVPVHYKTQRWFWKYGEFYMYGSSLVIIIMYCNIHRFRYTRFLLESHVPICQSAIAD